MNLQTNDSNASMTVTERQYWAYFSLCVVYRRRRRMSETAVTTKVEP
jgi:hypothetical protein